MAAELTAVEQRAQNHLFVTHCSLAGLRDRLPLPWPTPPHTPPSPKHAYRSQYVYLGWQDLEDPATWEHGSDYDLLLRLIDFNGLRPVLAQLLGWTSSRGWKPFDPVSLFLLVGWQTTNRWNRSQTLANLRDPRYADYAQRFGFRDDCFPTEGGLRHFLTTLGQHSTANETVIVDAAQQIEIAVQRLNELIVQSVVLIYQAGFISEEAWQHALLCPDGMLHEAASRLRCTCVTESCYQPTSPEAPRPCPAKDKDRRGCDCDTVHCAQICHHAPPRDPEARFVWYKGSNRPDNPNEPKDQAPNKRPKGKGVYGYRSFPLQFVDTQRRFSLVLLDDFAPANAREENPVAALLLQLKSYYPTLQPAAVAGDAAFGYDLILRIVYDVLHARRVIDLRAHPTDDNKALWPVRGYDDKGRPVCPYGYACAANGFDPQRRRYKWVCGHACRREKPLVQLPNVSYPPMQCPYLAPEHPHGRIANVGERFADGSIRLVRDLPVGSAQWKRIYHQARNAVEGRNATRERWDLKRLPVYGDPRGRATTFQADVWDNLTTMARLVREATAATGA